MANPTPSQWHPLCAAADLVAHAGVAAWTEAGPVALFWLPELDDALFAIGHQDPISGANVLARGIVGDIRGEPVVASPLYKQHFSLRSGRCLEDAEVSVPVYPVRLRNGQVEIALTAQREQAA